MRGVTFLDVNKREIPQSHPGLAFAVYVTLLFADQKNGDKNARRTQKRTDDPVMCPVRRAASLIERIRRLVPSFSGETTINTYAQKSVKGLVTLQLASGYLRQQLRYSCTCTTLGGKETFGFSRRHWHNINSVWGCHGIIPGKPLNRKDNADGPLAITGVSRLHSAPSY